MEFYFQINITWRIRFVLINYVVIGKLKTLTLLYTQSGLADWVSDSPILHKMLMKLWLASDDIHPAFFRYQILDMISVTWWSNYQFGWIELYHFLADNFMFSQAVFRHGIHSFRDVFQCLNQKWESLCESIIRRII